MAGRRGQGAGKLRQDRKALRQGRLAETGQEEDWDRAGRLEPGSLRQVRKALRCGQEDWDRQKNLGHGWKTRTGQEG